MASEAPSGDEPIRRMAVALSIEDFVARMWLEAEKPWGADAATFYTATGTFTIDDLVHAVGREAVRKVGSHRELIGPRVSRHLMTNYTFDFAALDDDGQVTVRSVMTHLGGTGEAPLPVGTPLGIYDVTAIVVRQPDGDWLLEQWRMRPAFLAADHPAFGMPRALSHPGDPVSPVAA